MPPTLLLPAFLSSGELSCFLHFLLFSEHCAAGAPDHMVVALGDMSFTNLFDAALWLVKHLVAFLLRTFCCCLDETLS